MKVAILSYLFTLKLKKWKNRISGAPPTLVNKDIIKYRKCWINPMAKLCVDFLWNSVLFWNIFYSFSLFIVRNPPSVCVPTSFDKMEASQCIEFYNISLNKNIGGCVRVDLNVKLFDDATFFDLNLGCFYHTYSAKEDMVSVVRKAIRKYLTSLKDRYLPAYYPEDIKCENSWDCRFKK